MATAVSPSRILKDLDQLWVDLSRNQQSDAPTAVLRACAMTLLVLTDDSAEDPGETLAMLMRDHPSRLIVIRLNGADGAQLDARVLAQCWMPFGRRQQICCEQIEIAASRSSLGDVPSVIRGLTVPDLPVAIWVRTSKLCEMAGIRPLLQTADKLVIDTAGVAALAAQVEFIRGALREGHALADLAWTRLTRWRESVAQAFDDPAALQRVATIGRVRIGWEGEHLPMSAVYIAAWMKHVLGRSPHFEFQPLGGMGRSRIHTIAVSGSGFEYSVAVAQDRSVELHTGVRASHTVFPRLSEYELLREELSVLGPDPVYQAVMGLVSEFIPKS